ncbi:hypothetical protein CEP52_000828 [Fusarium oligoseptatum]|uniref:Uncharacterized protein n=1 Tax=Fusarium oligoseptatum TaxID=2604345 RepID=A0A428ULN7_9HYPO|nr:hypothetical protein CEP52_000828 [Fusarium oligoseptatum]
MWSFLNYIVMFIAQLLYWLLYVKMTNWDENRRRQTYKEELEEFLRGEAGITQMMPEDEAGMRELLRRHPHLQEFFGQWEEEDSPPGSPRPRTHTMFSRAGSPTSMNSEASPDVTPKEVLSGDGTDS